MDISVLPPLFDFCRERHGPICAFYIPLLNDYEVGKLITDKSKISMGLNDIPARLLKLALVYTVEPLTYIYYLRIQKSVFLKMFKTAK